ncbi:MAG: acyl carrier protein [Kangiella sp.]|nr:MAG: acyl carrier protein [Gammaproteobacteria bacterium]PHS19815.1 MAG: acyl carrier protein [Kangiella sp.]
MENKMSDNKIQDQIKALIVEKVLVGVDPAEISNDSELVAELGLDSIQIIGLIGGLEEEFDIVLEDDDLDFELFSTINNLAKLVKGKL